MIWGCVLLGMFPAIPCCLQSRGTSLVICVLVHLINPFGMSRGHVFSTPRKVGPHEIQTGPGSSQQHHQSLGRWRDDATINAMTAAR